ncbi:MAG TPA: lysylphosphatidylglycerol synthase transmembrane domain-containing protein, partial [Caldilineaceae bacterium]|nr:lysylphosphatidylglycerol synthase transmembrane domain-containing protein [Caldilineaceae bacterium]
DRLFDLAALLVVGAAALVALPAAAGQAGAALAIVLAVSAVSGWLLLDRRGVALLQTAGARLGPWASGWVGSPQSRLVQLHHALRALSPQTLVWAGALTALAYALYFGQCWLLAQAAGLPVGVGPVSYATALGSLVTLLPISISGLGTREATLILYLGAAGVQPESALGFSLLIFAVFYAGSGALGLMAWWLKPAPWPRASLETSGGLHTGEGQA